MIRNDGTLKCGCSCTSWPWVSLVLYVAFILLAATTSSFPVSSWKYGTNLDGPNHVIKGVSLLEYSSTHRKNIHELDQRQSSSRSRRTNGVLFAVKKTKKQQLASGTKGFGAVVTIKTSSSDLKSGQSIVVDIDRSKATRLFYETTLASQKGSTASDNLKRTTLAYSYNASLQGVDGVGDEFKLRGVVATRDISKGQELISIPYEVALDLGPGGNDPTIPALAFLKDYCTVMSNSNHEVDRQKLAYYGMLPPFGGSDSRGCLNFFSEKALDALQSPYIVKETTRRRLQIQQRYERERPGWLWIDGATPISIDHLTWAVWIITSRVLTVQKGSVNDDDDGSMAIQYHRLLIPYLDMCNHDRSSSHVLTGRAMTGGLLKIVAGTNVAAGAPVEICYGGGMIGNDRFLQDYGFLDSHDDAFKFVAMDVLGIKRRTGGDESASLSLKDRQECLDAFRTTTIEEDEAILSSMRLNNSGDSNIETAILYRIGVKKALRELEGDR